jgi:hypothetical protein
LYSDGTYQHFEKPSDHVLNKSLFNNQYMDHIVKDILFTTAEPKVRLFEFMLDHLSRVEMYWLLY